MRTTRTPTAITRRVALVALTSAAALAPACERGNSTTSHAKSPNPAKVAMAGMDMGNGAPSDDKLGLTLVESTQNHVVVLNIVGPEQMFTATFAAKNHPTEGELMLGGKMAPIEASSRHFETHIYSRASGLPDTSVVPKITITDLDDGTVIEPEPTLMQDVIVGPRDIHFGNNVVIKGGHDFVVAATIGTEEVTFHGRLL